MRSSVGEAGGEWREGRKKKQKRLIMQYELHIPAKKLGGGNYTKFFRTKILLKNFGYSIKTFMAVTKIF